MVGHPINLKGLRLGKLIDSFPNVARVNTIKDEHLTIDKGERMTFWLRREPQHALPIPKHVDVMARRRDGEIYYTEYGKEAKHLGQAREHINKVLQYPEGYVPTTGTVLLSYIVHNDFSHWPVFVVGWFDMNLKLAKCHSYALERLYIQYLVNERKVYLIG